MNISKSEKKRLAKQVETLAKELIKLSSNELSQLFPDDKFLQDEIKRTSKLKTGALKRQTKFIASQLRQMELNDIFQFLEKKKGSKLNRNRLFHEIEKMRDEIINEALEVYNSCQCNIDETQKKWQGHAVTETLNRFPSINRNEINNAVIRYLKSRKMNFSRQIFRLLMAAAEQEKIS
jgi:ribosomal 50S subunit-associated protein YjgA (DUF615 family)